MTKTLRKGSKVEWASQSGGFNKVKSGVIVATVPAGKDPMDYMPEDMECNTRTGYGSPRKHKSYLVRVGKSCKAYWPLVSNLNKPITAKDKIKIRKIKRLSLGLNGRLESCVYGGLVSYDDHRAVVKDLIKEIEHLQEKNLAKS